MYEKNVTTSPNPNYLIPEDGELLFSSTRCVFLTLSDYIVAYFYTYGNDS